MLLGSVTPILFVADKTTNEDIQQGIFNMLLSNAIFCGISFLLVILCELRLLLKLLKLLHVIFYTQFVHLFIQVFKSKPPTPPSLQQIQRKDDKTDFSKVLLDLYKNKDFVTLIILYGVACGMWSVFGIIENIMYLHYFPVSCLN